MKTKLQFIPERYLISVLVLLFVSFILYNPKGNEIVVTFLAANIICILGSFDTHSYFLRDTEVIESTGGKKWN